MGFDMAKMVARISNKWLTNPRQPKLSSLWPSSSVHDITAVSPGNLIPNPNSGMWLVEDDESVINQMELDADSILWWSEYVTENPV